jgi:hypothetical protein
MLRARRLYTVPRAFFYLLEDRMDVKRLTEYAKAAG